MPVYLQLSDLLPSFFDSTVGRLTGENLVDCEREAVFEALLNSLRYSILRRVRYSEEPITPITTLETVDRFADHYLPRSEIIKRIEFSSGLGRPLAHLALLLIEMRVDRVFRPDYTEEVSIMGLGTITFYDRIDWHDYQRLDQAYWGLAEMTRSPQGNWWDTVRSWSSRSRGAKQRADSIIERLELIEMLRPFLPYRISLWQPLVFQPKEYSRGPVTEWLKTPDHTFLWRGDPNA